VDDLDRRIINHLQGGFPVSERPYAEVAVELGTDERTLIEHLQRLLDDRLLTRFGPMYQAERLGGGLTLAAMQVPERELDRVVAEVNAYPEVVRAGNRCARADRCGYRRHCRAYRLPGLQHAQVRRVLCRLAAGGMRKRA
jgi:DNA-binding Lrp family transcriptional regulator